MYEMSQQNSIPGKGKDSSLLCPDWLWVPPSLLSNGYLGILPQK